MRACSHSNAALIRKLITASSLPRLPESCCSLPSKMQDGPETDPETEGDPFRWRKVPGECGQNFHQEKQQGDSNPQPGRDPHRYSPLHHAEGEACGEPSHGRRHPSHFGARNEQVITKKQTGNRSYRNCEN